MSTPKGTRPWNAGTSQGWTDKRGYRWIYVLENGSRRAKREHRHVMEGMLGRKLDAREVVHHKDGNPSNNSPSNLELMSDGAHTTEHHAGSKRTDTAKARMATAAENRETIRHLQRVNAEMLEALRRVSGWAKPVTSLEAHDLREALALIASTNGGDK